MKEYQEKNKEKIQEYKKAYYDTNKENLQERMKEYYKTNKTTTLSLKKKNEKKCFESGCNVNKQNLRQRQRTKIHISFMKCI
jgi:hypothetical protein